MSWYPLLRDVGAEALRRSGWSEPRRRLRGKLSIATFHRVLKADEREEYSLPGLAVTPEELSKIIESLQEHFTCTTLADASARLSRGDASTRPLLALTFDDGQKDNATRALPVLEERAVKATFFVVSSAAETGASLWHDRLAFALPRALKRDALSTRALLSELDSPPQETPEISALVSAAKRFPSAAVRESWIARLERIAGGPWRPAWDGMLGFGDLRALHAAGHEIGSHSHSHPLLTQCDDAALERELVESRRQLERAIGAPVTSFCYPNGDWNRRVLEAVRRAGYVRAVTTKHGWNAPTAEVFALRRCDLSYTYCVDRRGRFSPARLAMRVARMDR
jgi:peptidoglycan/xylan/chitin deacetylase (PgdA/CDA1 family)